MGHYEAMLNSAIEKLREPLQGDKPSVSSLTLDLIYDFIVKYTKLSNTELEFEDFSQNGYITGIEKIIRNVGENSTIKEQLFREMMFDLMAVKEIKDIITERR